MHGRLPPHLSNGVTSRGTSHTPSQRTHPRSAHPGPGYTDLQRERPRARSALPRRGSPPTDKVTRETLILARFILAETLEQNGIGGRMAPPAGTGISARLRCVGNTVPCELVPSYGIRAYSTRIAAAQLPHRLAAPANTLGPHTARWGWLRGTDEHYGPPCPSTGFLPAPAVPASTRISARLERVGDHS